MVAMTESVQTASVAPVATSPLKKKTTVATKPNAPAHPSTAVMVMAAVAELKEKNGSSVFAIKKYMANNYKVDLTRLAPFIRKFLRAAVVKGLLLQPSGVGAMGRFKLLPPVVKKKQPAVASKKKKAVVAKKPAKGSAAGTPKKRKLPAKKATAAAAEPAAKKVKAVAAKKVKAVAAKPKKKSLVKAKKAVAAPKPPKVKKTTAVKQTKSPKKK